MNCYVIWKFAENIDGAQGSFSWTWSTHFPPVFRESEFYNLPCYPSTVPDLSEKLAARSRRRSLPGKYRMLATALDWYDQRRISRATPPPPSDEIFNTFLIPTLFARVARGTRRTPEEGARAAEARGEAHLRTPEPLGRCAAGHAGVSGPLLRGRARTMRGIARTIPTRSSSSWRRLRRDTTARLGLRDRQRAGGVRRSPAASTTSSRPTRARGRSRAPARIPACPYRVAAAEEAGLADRSVELVTVAQALHWFDRPALLAGGAPGSRSAAASSPSGPTTCFHIDEAVDRVDRPPLRDIVGPYWPPERALVERGLRLDRLSVRRGDASAVSHGEALDARQTWWGTCGTWSAVAAISGGRGKDPIGRSSRAELARAWGEPGASPPLFWDLRSCGSARNAIECRRDGRSSTRFGGRCGTCGSRSRTGATCAASTACRSADYVWLPRRDILDFEEISALVRRLRGARRGPRPADGRRAARAAGPAATRATARREARASGTSR